MSQQIIYQQFWMRRDTEANWAAANPILHAGEWGVVLDGATGLPMAAKLGDGSTAWNSLPYHDRIFWAAASGTNTITATFDPTPVLYDGMMVGLRAAGANTGATTFNFNGTGALSVTKLGGTALAGGEIAAAGQEILLVYRQSATRWELVGASNAAGISITDAGNYFTGTTVEAALQELGAGGGGGALTYLGKFEVTGSAATSVSATGLDLTSDGRYILEVSLKNATASLAIISAYFNADTTDANYDQENVSMAGATMSSSRANNAVVGVLDASATTVGKMEIINDLDGKPSVEWSQRSGATTTINKREGVMMWRTAANLTSVALTADIANSLAVGSYFKLWKLP